MADFPEKENQQSEQEELSTVFSDPTEHKTVKVKNKKLLPKILAGVLALAVLIGGTVAVIKLIPVLEDEETPSLSPETIEVKKLETDSVSAVSVTNTAGTVDFYSETEKTESDTESGSTETVNWYTKQVDKSLTSSSKIESVVGVLTEISSNLKITEKSVEECGLVSPKIKGTVNLKDGSSYTVLVGDKSPDNSGYYLKIADEDIIYLVSEDMYVSLEFDILDFADTSTISGFDAEDSEIADNFAEDGTITNFDRVVISGENYPEDIDIVPNTDNEISAFYGFLVKFPQKRLAENIDKITTLFQSGISPSGAYAYDVKPATIKKFGLDNPDVQIDMTMGNKTITYKIDLQTDGSYAVISNNSRLVHKVDASTLSSVVSLKTTDYYLPTIFLTNIDTLSNFTVNVEDKRYSFDIVKNEDEDAEEDYTITIDGKKLIADNFQNFYAECISLQTKDYVNDNLTGKPDISFVMTLKDGGKSTVEFTKVSATRYQCKLDGIGMGRVTTSDLNNIVNLVEKTANGETINF